MHDASCSFVQHSYLCNSALVHGEALHHDQSNISTGAMLAAASSEVILI